MRQVSGLRYGENPHQPAAFYADLSLAEVGRGGIAGSMQHHGKEVFTVKSHHLQFRSASMTCFEDLDVHQHLVARYSQILALTGLAHES